MVSSVSSSSDIWEESVNLSVCKVGLQKRLNQLLYTLMSE